MGVHFILRLMLKAEMISAGELINNGIIDGVELEGVNVVGQDWIMCMISRWRGLTVWELAALDVAFIIQL